MVTTCEFLLKTARASGMTVSSWATSSPIAMTIGRTSVAAMPITVSSFFANFVRIKDPAMQYNLVRIRERFELIV